MPKKQPRNAFFFYMVDFREEQKAKGITYKGLAEVALDAGPLWKDAPTSVRSQYENMAKQEKLKYNRPDMKFTSTGIPLSEIDRREKEARDAEENETKDIRNIVKLKAFDQSINKEIFYLMDVNYYCKVGSDYVFCECALLSFSLSDGVIDVYHNMIHPGPIPLGYASDAKTACIELGVNMPDEEKRSSNYKEILAHVLDFLSVEGNPSRAKQSRSTIPLIFTMPDKIEAVQNFIQQICIRAAYDETKFRIYHLNKLFYHLINAIKTGENEGFPKPSLALTQLEKDCYKYHAGIACDHHEEVDKASNCCTSRVKRWAFTILDHCCVIAGLDMIPGRHLPAGIDLEKVLDLKEKRRQTTVGSAAFPLNDSSQSESSFDARSNTSGSFNYSGEGASNSRLSYASKLSNQPLRAPKMNYAKAFLEAPQLTELENNFPTLSSGIGRGRGMIKKPQ